MINELLCYSDHLPCLNPKKGKKYKHVCLASCVEVSSIASFHFWFTVLIRNSRNTELKIYVRMYWMQHQSMVLITIIHSQSCEV